MKKLAVIATLCLAGSMWAGAGEPKQPYKGSAEFERMKSLVGTWKGKADMGQGPAEITVEYRLVSGGSAIEEHTFPGTPHEMVTMYHDKQGKLSLTHYCVLGNQPGMVLKSSDDKSIQFDFDATCGLDSNSGMHMHSLTLTFVSPDTITQSWRLFEDGKAKDDHPFTLKRVKT